MRKTKKIEIRRYFRGIQNYIKNKIPFIIINDGLNVLYSINGKFKLGTSFKLCELIEKTNIKYYMELPNYVIEKHSVLKELDEFQNLEILDVHSELDDIYILVLANNHDSIVISNDNYYESRDYFNNEVFDHCFKFKSFNINDEINVTVPIVKYLLKLDNNVNHITISTIN